MSWDLYDCCIGEITVLRRGCERIEQNFGKPGFSMDEYIDLKGKADALEHDLTDLWQKRSIKIAAIAVHPESDFEAEMLLPVKEQYFKNLQAANETILNVIKGDYTSVYMREPEGISRLCMPAFHRTHVLRQPIIGILPNCLRSPQAELRGKQSPLPACLVQV